MTNQIIYEDYDVNKMTSYEHDKDIDRRYGDRVISVDEVRDARGYLKQFKIELRPMTEKELEEWRTVAGYSRAK